MVKSFSKPPDHDVTSCFTLLNEERREHLDHHFYHTSEFAGMASVSVRTLRFYDRMGLLSPTSYTEAGYRLYTDRDFLRLQQILALKFLGFSLEEIKRCLQVGPTLLREALTLQKAMMQERREQLDAVIAAIDETQSLLQSDQQEWEAIVKVIRVIQMSQTSDWRKKYFSDVQLSQMEELSKQSYSEEQRAKLAEWGKGWSEEDQRIAMQRWDAFIAGLKGLVVVGADPGSPEAQALAGEWAALVSGFTRGDPGIQEGLKNLYRNLGNMPASERPFPMPYTKEEEAFLRKMIEAYQESQE